MNLHISWSVQIFSWWCLIYFCWAETFLCPPIQPEGDPGDDDDQRGRNVDLDEVVSHWPHKLNLTSQTGVVAWCVDLLFTWWPWRGEILTCRQTGLNSLLTVSEHFELWQWDVPRHLNRVEAIIPLVSDVGHSVANWKDKSSK